MQGLILLLFLCAPAFGAFSFTATPNAVIVYHYGAKVIVSTSVATSARVVWDTVSRAGACANYANSDADGATGPVHSWFIGGAPANTRIFWEWCNNDGSGEQGSGEQSFMTLPLPNPHPAPARVPQTNVDTSMPVMSGATRTVGADCATLLDCWNLSIYGDTIQIPAATPQQGNYALPPKPWKSGWIVIRTDQPDSSLPPPGVRLDPAAYGSSLASLENPAMSHYDTRQTPMDNAHCFPGAYYWNHPVDNTPGWYMNQCVGDTSYSIANVSGSVGNGGVFSGAYVVPGNNFAVNDIVYAWGITGCLRCNGTGRVTSVNGDTVRITQANGYVDRSASYSGTGGAIQRHIWQPVPLNAVSLSSLPGSCTTGDWGFDANNATQDYDNAGGPIAGTTSTGSVVRCVTDKWAEATPEKRVRSSGANGYLKTSRGPANVWKTWKVWLRDPVYSSPVYGIDLSGVTHVRFIGIRFSRVRVPPEPLFLRDGGDPAGVTSFQGGKGGQPSINQNPATTDIIYDRCFFDGLDYPNGMSGNAGTFTGDRIAIVESYLSGYGNWFGPQDRGSRYDNFASAAILRSAGTTSLFRNNYLESSGLTLHNDDSFALWLTNIDGTVFRNTFYRKPAHFYGNNGVLGGLTSNGVYYPQREEFECKSCQQFLIDGNTFSYNWRNTSQGAAILLSPRVESSATEIHSYAVIADGHTLTWPNLTATNLLPDAWVACGSQLYQILTTPTANSATVAGIANGNLACPRADWRSGVIDITISNNTFQHFPNAIYVIGTENVDNTGGGAPFVSGLPVQRVTLRNNLYNDTLDDGTRQDPNLWQSNGGGYDLFNVSAHIGDVIVQHETHVGLGGAATTAFGGSRSGFQRNSEGILYSNNIVSMASPSSCAGTCVANSPINGAALSGNALFSSLYANSSLANCLFQMAGGNPGGYPNSIGWLNGVAGYNFIDAATGNFRLGAGGPAGALDGVGISQDALEAEQGIASNMSVGSIDRTSADVSFLAPDSFGCTVDWSADGWMSFTRVPNAGGDRNQSVHLNGLPSQTVISYRINCPVQQLTGTFSTQ